jgi:hypothetical protein
MNHSAIPRRSASAVIFLLLTILLWHTNGAQPVPATSPSVDPVIQQIREEGLNRSHISQTLDYLCNVIGQRLTASPSQARASQWTRQTLADWGLNNAHLEPWGPFGRGWSLDQYSLQVTAPYTLVPASFPKAWSPGFDGPVTADVVYLDARTKKELAAYAGHLKGKFVLLGQPRVVEPHFEADATRLTDDELTKLANAPAGRSRTELMAATTTASTGPATRRATTSRPSALAQNAAAAFAGEEFSFAAREGAAVIIDASSKGDGGTIFVAGASVPGSPPPPLPGTVPPSGPSTRPRAWSANVPPIPAQITLGIEDFNRLVSLIRHGQTVTMSLNLHVHFYAPAETAPADTIAEIPGSDLKDEIVMVGGHLDSWHSGTGATDNGAGAASAMEAVRILKALNLHPRRTIRIALWTGEEEGLLGSTAYVKQHFGFLPENRGPATRAASDLTDLTKGPEYEHLSVYFNLDNGTGKIRGIYAQSNPAAVPIFHQWLMPFNDLGAKTVTLANTGSTDHIPFDRIGLPGFQFIQDPIEYMDRTHHSNADVFDHLALDDLKQASTIMAAFLWEAANMEQRFPRKAADSQPAR